MRSQCLESLQIPEAAYGKWHEFAICNVSLDVRQQGVTSL